MNYLNINIRKPFEKYINELQALERKRTSAAGIIIGGIGFLAVVGYYELIPVVEKDFDTREEFETALKTKNILLYSTGALESFFIVYYFIKRKSLDIKKRKLEKKINSLIKH
ncbi:MAG TPA: hypothetical protein PKA54_10080 [Chitinophagaceae bacterium]|nr:hypothetical protein [Chitinophagaceae bacterium]